MLSSEDDVDEKKLKTASNPKIKKLDEPNVASDLDLKKPESSKNIANSIKLPEEAGKEASSNKEKPVETKELSQIKENSSLFMPSKTLETSSILQSNAKKLQILDQNTKRVQKSFCFLLLGDDHQLPITRAKFLYEFIPESSVTQIRNSLEFPDKDPIDWAIFPIKHSFPKDSQTLFLFEFNALNGTKEDTALVWFCENNNLETIDYLRKNNVYKNFPSVSVIVLENEPKPEEPQFKKELDDFCKAVKTNPLKINLKNPKSVYDKFKKYLSGYISDIQAETREKISKLKEIINPNPKLDRLLLSDLAFLFTANQGIIPLDVLEKKAYMLMGRPNDLLLSQFRKSMEPYLEKYKQMFQKSNEENINKSHKSKILRPARRNPLFDEKFAGKLILTESEAKELVKDYCEILHFNGLKTSKKINKEGLLRNPMKEAKSAMHINIESRFKAYLGFPSGDNFLEIRDFLEKTSVKAKEAMSQEYEETLNKKHKSLKPKALYKSFDPLKRDFHGQEISKLVAKESLDVLADYLVRQNPSEELESQDIKLLTGFIGLKETKHMTKRLARTNLEIKEMKGKQKVASNIIEGIKERLKTDELMGNLQRIRTEPAFEDWALVYLKNDKASQEAVQLMKGKEDRKISPGGRFKKVIRINPVGYEENSNDVIKKIGRIRRIMLIVNEETPSNVEILRKFLEKELLLPKKSHSLQKVQLLIYYFTVQNSTCIEGFENFIRSISSNINVSLQEEPVSGIKSFFEFQFFSKLTKHYEKQATRPKDPEEPKPSLQGLVAPSTKAPALSYETFLEMLGARLFPGETLSRELMDELFRNWFVKHENNFDAIDFTKLYQKALKKINRIIEMVEGKMVAFRKKEKELQISLERNKENAQKEEFLAVKIEDFQGLTENLVRKKKFALEIQYANDKIVSNRLNLAKSFTVNEKFLMEYLPDQDFQVKLIQIEDKEKSQLDNLDFILKLKELKPEDFPLGVIKETLLNSTSDAPELKAITIKLRYKRLVYSEEKALIKIRKFDELLKNFNDYLTQIYRYKYDLLEVFAPKSSENAEFIGNHFSFMENLQVAKPPREPVKEVPGYDEELSAISRELEAQNSQIKNLENQQKNDKAQQEALEAEIKKLEGQCQGLNEDKAKEKAALQAEIERKNKNLDEFKKSQGLNPAKIDELGRMMKEMQLKMEAKQKEKQGALDVRTQIVEFFTKGKNDGLADEDLRKLQEYFLYLQKSILKFYNKAVIVEADVFEMKSSSIKAGLGCLAGSVPFLGNLLKFVVETAIDLKKAYDERKFVRKCLKFSTMIHSQRILAEITEEVAFLIIKNPAKQKLIMEASKMKESTMEALKKKLVEFFNKAKDFFSRKKKNKTQEKLLKDLDTPAKLLGNIDGGYLCTQAVEKYSEMVKTEDMGFNAQDPYNKKGMVSFFIKVIEGIDPILYEKVIGFEEMKDFKAVLEVSEEALKEKIGGSINEIEPTHEEIKAVTLEDPETLRKIEQTNEELAIFKERQDKNEKKLLDLIEEHNLQHSDLEAQEKRIGVLEKQATLGLNYLGGLNQEVSDLKERVENLYNSMNVKYQEILKKLEEGVKVEENSEAGSGILKKLSKSEKFNSNDPFFMYLEKNSGKLKTPSTGLKTPNKQLLTPLTKKQ